jgi:diguanylate cyclase (GGDEF)-like protein/PAS domain S-box-containing protein
MSSISWEYSQLALMNLEDKPSSFFKRLISSSITPIVITDPRQPDNPIVYVNPAFETLTGYRLADVLGRNCRFLQNDDNDQPALHELRACLAQHLPFTGALRNYRSDGAPFWSRMHIFPTPGDDDGPGNYIGFLEDVTALVGAQQAAERAHDHLSTVLGRIADGCFSVDRDWRITYINERGAEWLRHRPAELIGQVIWEAFPDAVGGPFHQTYVRALANQEPASCESFYEPLGLWIEARAYPSRDGLTVFFADVTARKESEKRLLYLATHDSLTGLHNRLSCLRALDEALRDAAATRQMVGVLFVDLDHFKEVNDAHGHRYGDQALQEIGRRLARFEDGTTTVARISGDEFVFVQRDTDELQARALAACVLRALTAPIPVDDQQVAIGASIGIAIGGAGVTPDELLNNADAAMYEAKANGRHTSAVFSPSARLLIKQRLKLRQEVFSALDRRQFVLYYQPQVACSDGAVVGAEALLRWDHPQLGMLAPAAFLAMIEDSPAMTAVGAWVCAEACRQAREWERMGFRIDMGVNVSPRQLADENLLTLMKGQVCQYGLDPACIKLEVTESMLMQDIDTAAAVLGALHRDGFCIALDDFGTGYSNLAYLRRLPITSIKIDRSFVHDIEGDRRGLDLVNGIIAFAKSLKLSVICEGIETEAQKAAIRSTGCDVLQGYLIGRPMPPAEFGMLLRAQHIGA